MSGAVARAVVVLGVLLLGMTQAAAGPVIDRIRGAGTLRVCVWPAYYGITFRNPHSRQLSGLDVELSAALARDLGVRLEHVDSDFISLVRDLTTDACDIAMFAIGILPQRVAKLAFSEPYLQSDIYAITTRSSRVVTRWEDIDQPAVRVAVQAGTFMEPVMRARLKQAQLVVVSPPDTRETELEAGRVDVFMTDYPYSRRLLDKVDWARLVEPAQAFHVLPYGYAVKPGDALWLAEVNAFVARIKRDGRLAAAARKFNLGAIVVP
jgi:cyclohexadienyl dehydratase